ncbi:ATP-binding protein [Winogradskyella immobilis]|uniref:DNA binding domain-containing protein n=1 Tax=Winogradskyella immobilis TaxID=2816852 RepID=A0ABS8ER34_9FLAO|nr:RNA-binding domain-containing protein [Winogradskyella immobilis]MCC1485638.1 putative DNA binding domain-containing protein [Winogradskyella immobilis]MCG0017730.1 putative DNA binding domain-containing protein [Winogradskyella immobilis]
MNKGQTAITELIKEFKTAYSIENDLLVNLSTFQSLDPKLEFSKVQRNENELNSIDSNFDLIFGDFPFGMNRIETELLPNKKISQNWNSIFKSLKLLNDKGFAFFVAEPSIIYSKQALDFLNAINANQFYLNLVLKIPSKIYEPHTNFQPILIGFSKEEYQKLFIADLDQDNIPTIVQNFKEKKGTELENGIWVNRDSFQSFSNFSILNQIGSLKTQYKEYKEYQLSEIALEINLTRESFEEKPNSIYIPKIGTSDVVSSLSNLKIKPQNYFQVVLNNEIVLADYLALFYKSELGQLILNSLNTGSFIPSINKGSIQDSFVAIPKLEEQKLLVHTNSKLEDLQNTIEDLRLELSLNPKNAPIILEKFDTIQGPLKTLSVEDEILALIRKGEGKQIEFKQTFSKNIHTQKKDPAIEKSSLKNVVGFLNAKGGTLLIGVADDNEITGIEDDFYKSNDKYLLNFKNAINSKIGSEFYPLIEYDIYKIWDKKVLKVDCQPSKRACFYDTNEFYVRTNPATDRLEGQKLIEYVNRRFAK